MGPHAPAHEADGDAREHHERVAEDRLAGEHRDDLRHDAEGRAGSGCTPPGARRSRTGAPTAAGRRPACTLKKLASNSRSKVSRNSATEITGMANTQQHLRDQAHPGEHRHLHQRHARRPHVEHGDHQVDAADERGDAGDLQADGVEVHAVARARRSRRCWGRRRTSRRRRRRRGTTTVLRKIPPKRNVQKLERVEPREGDVTGADLQRDQVVHERRAHRHDDQEDHRDAVHREDLVVERRPRAASGRGAASWARMSSASAPPIARKNSDDGAVHDPDLLVVDRADPRPPPGLGPRTGEDAQGRVRGGAGARRAAPARRIGIARGSPRLSATPASVGRRRAASICTSLSSRLGMPARPGRVHRLPRPADRGATP